MEQALKDKVINAAQLSQAVLVLCSNGVFSAAQDDLVVSKTKKITDKLNAHLLMKARCSNEITHLASPVTGGGVSVPRFQQLFILSIQQGKKKPEEWASDVWQILTIQRQKIVKEGKTLETIEENLAEIKEQAILFAEKKLPILKALQIA
jgi:hypothetical protein